MGMKVRASREFYAPERAIWRQWLSDNHDRYHEVALVFYRKAVGKPCISYEDAVQEAVCFGWIDGIKRKLDEERYSYRFTPRRPGSKWSDSNKRRVALLEEAGLLHPAGIAAIERAKASGIWEQQARSPVPDTMPVELQRALDAAPGAKQVFEALAPSHKRNWLRYVAEGKRVETRERRSARCVGELEPGGAGE